MLSQSTLNQLQESRSKEVLVVNNAGFPTHNKDHLRANPMLLATVPNDLESISEVALDK